MAGTLSRYEGMRGFRTWKPYTFALQRHILSYADAHNSKNVRGYILLNKHYTLSVKSRMRQIILECRNQKEGATYILRAEDVRSWNEWVNILTITLTHIGNIWFEEQHQQKNNGK